MADYSIHPLAETELDGIIASINGSNAAAARKWLHGFRRLASTLAAMPRMGRARDDLVPGMHMFAYRNYLVCYQLTDTGIEILHVIHGARDTRTPSLWEN